jgi:hypothetical protein
VAAERGLRTPTKTWSQLFDLAYGDRVAVRGAGAARGELTIMIVESVEVLLRADAQIARAGTLEDVLAGPLPMPAILELTTGRKMLARVLGRDGNALRLRTSLRETRVPVRQIRAARRLAYGTTCRAADGRVDFLTSLPLRGPTTKVFAAAAARIMDDEIRGTVVRGVRAGRDFGLIIRTERLGDVLVYVAGRSAKATSRWKSTYACRRLAAALCLKRGDEVVGHIKKSYLGLAFHGESSPMLVRGEFPYKPEPPEDPDRGQLTDVEEDKLEMVGKLFRRKPEHGVRAVLDLQGATRRIALRRLARYMDHGMPGAAAAMRLVVSKLPPAEVPRHVPAAAIRRIFTARKEKTRVACAEIIGMAGCREGAAVLAEATDLYPGATFAAAARRAMERIKLTPAR